MEKKYYKLIHNLIGIAILPLTAAAIGAFFVILLSIPNISAGGYYFIAGIVLNTIITITLPRPVRLYILGHELTHALWSKLFGGKVSKIRVSKYGGSVHVSVTNIWVILAPYFFPIYTIIIGVIFSLLSLVFDMKPYFNLFLLFAGFTLQFHYLQTGKILEHKQPDIFKAGVFISLALIPLINVLILILFMEFLLPDMRILHIWSEQTWQFLTLSYLHIVKYAEGVIKWIPNYFSE